MFYIYLLIQFFIPTDTICAGSADCGRRKLKPYIATKMAFIISKMSNGKHAFSGPLLQLFDRDLPNIFMCDSERSTKIC